MDSIDCAIYIDIPELYEYAASAARLMTPEGEGAPRGTARRYKKNMRRVQKCRAEIERRYGACAAPPAACEWIMDNWYMLQREYRAAQPLLKNARAIRRSGRETLLEGLCRNMLLSGRGEVTEERFTAYLEGFQSVTVLTREELYLLPTFLSAAITESVAGVCREMRYASDTDVYAERLKALFTTLRLFNTADLQALTEKADITDRILSRGDPTGEYERMDAGTKREYLKRVEKLAKRTGERAHIYAQKLTEKAAREKKHVGEYLFPARSSAYARIYIAANVLFTLFFALLAAFGFESALAAALLLLPISELIKSAVDSVLLRVVKPRRLFRMDTRSGVGSEGRTICVISALLGAEASARRLEEVYFACKGEGAALMFGLLADYPAADTAETEADAALLRQAREGIERLNMKYGRRFYLFTRPREFDGERYSAHERKRGAILELAKLLCDEKSALEVYGEKDALAGVKYILTLDSDTRVYPGAVGELIGAILHPLNRPRINAKTKTVTSGHAIIHPRIDTDLETATATDFALIYAGAGGSDPYGALCGEVYMDAFDCGGFAGKGIIDARSLLVCTRGFPKGRVLSHDAPEGAYLRGAYMSDAEFSDRFPARPLDYFKRLHRWVRGDWQNLRFAFDPALREIDRWRIADSIRRSMIAPATLAAICAGFFMAGRGIHVAAWAALCALLTGLFSALAEHGLSRRRAGAHARRYARLFTGVGGAMVKAFIRLWLLPYEAWITLTAAVTALWRTAVTRKKLLEWQTAAETRGETGLWAHMRAMYFPVLLGAVLLFTSPAVIGKSAGLMWLLSPLAAFALALEAHRDTALAENEREYILQAAKRSLGYFKSFFSVEDSFLPPDNFQEQPPVGLARRTSPTNIGLALAAHTACVDMGLITKEECAQYTSRVLDTLERMPRHMGHFYNWYDTATLVPLLPAYISTVDSGNMYAGLMTARRAMEEYGEAELAERLGALMKPMSFAPLYDKGRGLFHICYDTANERGAGGWYDLMASEAMLTSYIALAKGDVPVRHWRRLSRALLEKDGYRGLASWTGTMFEYLMPELFVPVYRGSLLYESVRFCLYAQKKRVWPGNPWGISESAFYSLDNALNYRYKAHGCAALSLKRGQDEDLVISPYSSFLALAVDPESAVRNLRHLEKLGAVGRWGFIEALDFTPSRCTREGGEQVCCYMAHHIGMSILAAANAVCDKSVQRRFMSSPEMAAFSLLLQERADMGGVLIRRDYAPMPERTERCAVTRWQLRGGEHDTDRRACVLSNGAYSIMADNRMNTSAKYGDIAVYDCTRHLGTPGGVTISLEEESGKAYTLTPCESPVMWELEEDAVRIAGEAGSIDYAVSLSAAYGDCGEGRAVTLCARENTTLALTLSFKPLLTLRRAWEDHPSFWALGITAEEEKGALILHRIRRGDLGEVWLCVASSVPLEFSADENGGLGALSRPLVKARAELTLSAGQTETVRFAVCAGRTREESTQGAQRILVSGVNDRGNMVSASATHLKMSAEEVGAAMEMLTALWPERVQGAQSVREAWQYGVSGDFPLICCDGRALESEALIRRFCLIKSCGAECELVFFTDEEGEYRRPVFRKLMRVLESVSLEALMGAPGGVHVLPVAAANAVISRAAVTIGTKKDSLPQPPLPELGAARCTGSVPKYGFDGEKFHFTVDNSLPARVWQNVLSNGSTGYIAADCGTGYMWYENAHEMRISPPCADINAVSGNEALWAETGGENVSLFAANDGRECRVSFEPGAASWEKTIGRRKVKLTAFVPVDTEARVFIVEGAAGLKLNWTMKLIIGAKDAKSVRITPREGAITAENPDAFFPGAEVTALCSLPCETGCAYFPPAVTMSVLADDVTVFVCGTDTEPELRSLAECENAVSALKRMRDKYKMLLSRFSLETGHAALDSYMSTWCVYQSVVCRMEARASLYQSGGAIGFRDQLQDAVNLILINPAYARERILDCCRHQYAEGDVMHWWHRHPEGDRGVRTRCADDLMWLVWALCEYTEKTGDITLCREEVRYLVSKVLADTEHDRYETPPRTGVSESVFDHARCALEMFFARGTGEHGLPQMGSGDWNDALNEVEGESVWLAWFGANCAARFAALCDTLGEEGAEKYRRAGEKLSAAAEKAWTGRWYARGYFAAGDTLGGEERIDSVAQSWAVLSGARGDSNRPCIAVDAAIGALFEREKGLIKLLSPPYPPDSAPSPGYIVSYGEGYRENGGQYTHGAVWLAMAAARLGRSEDAWAMLTALLPEGHDMRRYAAEPFVLPADVSAAKGHEGEAGWSWYTGSAGWYFRAVTEEILGMRLNNGKLTLSPHLPGALRTVRVSWTDFSGTAHDIELTHALIRVDGREYHGGEIG